MARSRLPTALENVEKSRQVGLRIGVRVGERMAYACLGGEMNDQWEAIFSEQAGHAAAIGKIKLDEMEPGERGKLAQLRLFQRRIIIRIQIIEADDGAAALQQALRDMKADEPGCAGHEYWFSRHAASYLRFA